MVLLVFRPGLEPRPFESLLLASRRKKWRSEGSEEQIHPMPVSIFEQSMVWATQTSWGISKQHRG
jgi:hypothetical protein